MESMYDRMVRVRHEAEAGIWTTGGGRRIPVEEMSIWFLMNTISMLERRNCPEMWDPWLKVLREELKRRQDDGDYDSGRSDKCGNPDSRDSGPVHRGGVLRSD